MIRRLLAWLWRFLEVQRIGNDVYEGFVRPTGANPKAGRETPTEEQK